jgi:hypothetical protein
MLELLVGLVLTVAVIVSTIAAVAVARDWFGGKED